VRYRTYEAPLNSDTFFWGGLHPRASWLTVTSPPTSATSGAWRDMPRYFDEQHGEHARRPRARLYAVPAISLRGRDASIESYLARGDRKSLLCTAVAALSRVDDRGAAASR
jgi:hypothetical protein